MGFRQSDAAWFFKTSRVAEVMAKDPAIALIIRPKGPVNMTAVTAVPLHSVVNKGSVMVELCPPKRCLSSDPKYV